MSAPLEKWSLSAVVVSSDGHNTDVIKEACSRNRILGASRCPRTLIDTSRSKVPLAAGYRPLWAYIRCRTTAPWHAANMGDACFATSGHRFGSSLRLSPSMISPAASLILSARSRTRWAYVRRTSRSEFPR